MALNIDQLSAAGIAAGVAAGDFSATEVAKASLDAIEAREGGVQAFLQVSPSSRSTPPPRSTPTARPASPCPRSPACPLPSRTT